MKNIFVEPYDPLINYGRLMLNKNRISWIAFIICLAVVTIVGCALIVEWGILTLLLFPFLAILFTWEEDSSHLYLIRKKRGPRVNITHVYPHWYDTELAEYDSNYQNKLIEYFDFLRLGEEQNKSIEKHLSEWRHEAEISRRIKEDREEKMTALSFINESELEEYKEFRHQYEKLVEHFTR